MKRINFFLSVFVIIFCVQKHTFSMNKKKRTVYPVSFGSISTPSSDFLPDPVEEELSCCKKNSHAFQEVLKFFKNDGLGVLLALFASSKQDRRFNLYNNKIVADPACGLKTDKESKQIVGLGAQMFVDTRNSCSFWAKKGDSGKLAATFRDQIGDKHFYPVAKKYGLEIFNTAGDGYLLGRVEREDEQKEKTIEDTVRCGIELIARFKNSKKKHALDGPEACGTGIAFGEFVIRFVPIFVKTDSSWAPTVDGDAVNVAFFCEQANKKFNAAMTITEEVHAGIQDEALKNIFQSKPIKFKHEDFQRNVFCASSKDITRFYENNKP